jgi:hypothetical protein
MRVERIVTRQGHPVPNTVTRPRGPFSEELLAEPKIIYDYARQGEDGNEENLLEGTAQNNFQDLKWFTCNDCNVIIPETQLETHTC